MPWLQPSLDKLAGVVMSLRNQRVVTPNEVSCAGELELPVNSKESTRDHNEAGIRLATALTFSHTFGSLSLALLSRNVIVPF